MSEYTKSKAVSTYCFQIWLTSVVLGPVFYLIWRSKQFTGFTDWLGFEVIVALYSILFSIPGMLLFSGGAAFLFRQTWPVWVKRLILSIWSILLTVSAYGILFEAPVSIRMDMFPGSICYCLPSFLGVWIYRWPSRMK